MSHPAVVEGRPADVADTAVPLAISGLTKWYGTRLGVTDLELTLHRGTVTGFLGPNGAGKTTTLRLLAGLLTPSAGDVTIFGRPAREPAARERLGFMPADPVFLDHLSGRDNLDLFARLRGDPRSPDRSRVCAALELAESDLDVAVGAYSSGMRQKLGIVAALQHRPDLVVLDEPANRLDPIAHHAFIRLMRDTATQGRTVFLSSHVLGEVEDVCDQVALIREGRLLRLATVDELRQGASRSVTLRYRTHPSAAPDALTDARVDGTTVTGRIPPDRPDVVRRLIDDADIADVLITPARLEDVFLDLYGETP